jgi:DNA-binding NtrC family response regulator
MESELFGYEKGAFTGATKSKRDCSRRPTAGRFSSMKLATSPRDAGQASARSQEKEVRPVGSNERINVDVRVIAATNRDLEAAYRDGTFRKDLYFRLNVVTVHLPPLRERRSDIPTLVHHFLNRYAPTASTQVTPAAMKSLLQYDWPGNVRELENTIARAITLGDQQVMDVKDLPPAIRAEQPVNIEMTPTDAASFPLPRLPRWNA